MTLYKWLNGRTGTHATHFRYRLRSWTPPVAGALRACHNGYHLMQVKDLSFWIAQDLFVAETDDEIFYHDRKVVVRRCRIVEHLKGWNKRTARLAAADFAESALPVYEKTYLGDERPRLAIQAARDYANGLISAAACRAAYNNVNEIKLNTGFASYAALMASIFASAVGNDHRGVAINTYSAAIRARDARRIGTGLDFKEWEAAIAEEQGKIILAYATGERG